MPDRRAWRRWLNMNHDRSPGIWLVFYRRQAGVRCVPYEDSVEEAICFGWVDSQIRRVDLNKYARKYTPRHPGSRWSPSNIERAEKMIRERRMTDAGLRQIAEAKNSGIWYAPESRPKNVPVPESLREALDRNRKAKENFEAMAASYRDSFAAWVAAAKTETTRRKRVMEAVGKLERSEKLGLR
jgi:uncharacterized protein YdeI (YjbR/CyaY-like superfamily)